MDRMHWFHHCPFPWGMRPGPLILARYCILAMLAVWLVSTTILVGLRHEQQQRPIHARKFLPPREGTRQHVSHQSDVPVHATGEQQVQTRPAQATTHHDAPPGSIDIYG